MRVGILTFHRAHNYGAVLQAFALQQVLRSLGHDAYVLDHRPAAIESDYKVFGFKWRRGASFKVNLYLLLWGVLVIPIKLRRTIRFRRFVQRRLRVFPFDPKTANSDIDAYVTGSDQVWSPFISQGFDLVYFGRFPAAASKRVIAYAASAGSVEKLPPSGWQTRLSQYAAISVREKSLADFLQAQTNCHIIQTLDPVLLAGRPCFESLIAPVKATRPYLLVFVLGSDGQLSAATLEVARKVAAERKLSIRYLVPMSSSLKHSDWIKTASPTQFLSLVSGADYVVTTSFHGTAFSILLEKDFTTITSGATSSNRMTDLLASLGLSTRAARSEEELDSSPIDYELTRKTLEAQRESSLSFLRNALA